MDVLPIVVGAIVVGYFTLFVLLIPLLAVNACNMALGDLKGYLKKKQACGLGQFLCAMVALPFWCLAKAANACLFWYMGGAEYCEVKVRGEAGGHLFTAAVCFCVGCLVLMARLC